MTGGISMKTGDSKEHQTPWWIVRQLEDELPGCGGFDLDPAATFENKKAPAFFSKEEDGLNHSWSLFSTRKTFVYCNPPYGVEQGQWAEKAWRESFNDVVSYLLVKVVSDTDWWLEFAMKAAEIRFVHHRVKYEGVSDGPSTFPSAILVYDHALRLNLPAPPVVSMFIQAGHTHGEKTKKRR
jgi:phage N-6-adenine-methyltransferase